MAQKKFNCMHGLNFSEIGWIGHALLVQPSISAHRKWPEMVVSGSTNQVWTKITIISYAWSFAIHIQIQAVWVQRFWPPFTIYVMCQILFLVILDASSECQTATFTINGNTGKYNFYYSLYFMPYFFHDVHKLEGAIKKV